MTQNQNIKHAANPTKRVFVFEDLTQSNAQITLHQKLSMPDVEVVSIISDDDLRHRFHREPVDLIIIQHKVQGTDTADAVVFIRGKLDPRQLLPIFIISPEEISQSDKDYYLRLGVSRFITGNYSEEEIIKYTQDGLNYKATHNRAAELQASLDRTITDLKVTLADLRPEFEIPKIWRQKIAVTGSVVTSIRLGGDSLFFRPFPDGKFAFAVFDSSVSGHEALSEVAFFQGVLDTAFRMLLPGDPDPLVKITEMMNRILLEKYQGVRIMTIFLGVVNLKEMTLQTLSAASPLPIVLDRQRQRLVPTNMEPGIPLGVEEEAEYTSSTSDLSPGTRLMLITNGLIHQRDRDGTNYILPMIKKVLTDNASEPIRKVSGLIQTEFEKRQTMPQYADDAAFLLIDIED